MSRRRPAACHTFARQQSTTGKAEFDASHPKHIRRSSSKFAQRLLRRFRSVLSVWVQGFLFCTRSWKGRTLLYRFSITSPREGYEILRRVCLSVCLYVLSRNSKTAQPNFTTYCACCLLLWLGPVLTALPLCYVLPVLWMTLRSQAVGSMMPRVYA